MKVRFDGLDVQAMVALLQRTVLGRRVVNIYDGDSTDSYVFKLEGDVNASQQPVSSSSTKTMLGSIDSNLAVSAPETSKSKEFLWLESGIRFHLTANRSGNSSTVTSTMPTPFVAKLRKHLRSLRLEKVVQLGSDRVVLFQFGVGPSKHAIILELYAKGNLILVDKEYRILALLRSHVYHQEEKNIANMLEKESKLTNNNHDKESTQKKKPAPGKGNNDTANAAAVVQVGQVYPVTYATSMEKTISTATTQTTAPSNKNPTIGDSQSNVLITNEEGNEVAKAHENPTNSILEMVSSKQLVDWLEWTQQDDERLSVTTTTRTNNTSSETNKTKSATSKKESKKKNVTLKTVLLRTDSGVSHYGPALIEHCILSANLSPNIQLKELLLQNKTTNGNDTTSSIETAGTDSNNGTSTKLPWHNCLLSALQNEGKAVIDALQEASKRETPGYILYRLQTQSCQGSKKDAEQQEQQDPKSVDSNETSKVKIYEEFQPHLLKQHEKRLYQVYNNFSDAVDEFYASLAHQKALLRAQAAEVSVATKLQKIHQDQADRVRALEKEQENMYQQANAVQLNADSVDKALMVINSGLDSGMDWDQLENVVNIEKKENQNPIAMLIHELDLEHDSMIVRLPNYDVDVNDDDNDDDDDDGHEEKLPYIDVKILLKETAHANASRLFAKYRSSKEKSQKTIDASTKALKAAEENAKKQLLEAQKRNPTMNATTGPITKRVYCWFEKFHWFITSDNYLVIGGRDAHQNELLVKRYLRPGDAYLHADVFGASSCILRAKRRRRKKLSTTGKGNSSATTTTTEIVPLSQIALREAGNFTICHSSAWSNKIITSAWWVESYQVTKTAPTGEYLTTGAFMIRGKKNYLPPTSPLEMGLAILFKYNRDDVDAVARHQNERRDFALMMDNDDDDDNDNDIAHEYNDNNRHQKHESNEDEPNEQLPSNRTSLHDDELAMVSDDSQLPIVDHNHKSITDSGDQGMQTEYQETNVSESNQFDNDDGHVSDDDSDDDANDDKNTKTYKPANEVLRSTDQIEDTKQDETLSSANQQKQQTKRGLSVRDRKLIKKYGSLAEAERILAQQKQQQHQTQLHNNSYIADGDQDVASTVDTISTATTSATTKRGKKAKEKRAMKKYADQDEEDRELALLALQGGEKKFKNKNGGSASNKKGGAKGGLATSIQQQEELAAETTSLLVKDSYLVASKLSMEVKEILEQCIGVREEFVTSSKVDQANSNQHIENNDEKTRTLPSRATTTNKNRVIRWEKIDGDTLEQLLSLEPIEAQIAASKRLLQLKQTTRIDNFSASLGGIIRTIRKYGYKTSNDDVVNDDLPNANGNLAQGQGVGKRKNNNDKKAESEQWKNTVAEEGITASEINDDDLDDSAAVDDTIELSYLTGKPHPEDLLLYCVPVCGPYSALQHYTYRLKLTPGTLKRGKAAKQCLELFLKSNHQQQDGNNKQANTPTSTQTNNASNNNGGSNNNSNKLQLELIKRVPDNDWIQAICADVKISAPGASKVAGKASSSNQKSKGGKSKK